MPVEDQILQVVIYLQIDLYRRALQYAACSFKGKGRQHSLKALVCKNVCKYGRKNADVHIGVIFFFFDSLEEWEEMYPVKESKKLLLRVFVQQFR